MIWKLLKKTINKMILKSKMRRADDLARYYGVYSHMILPPSYYMSHTEEEIKQAKKDAIAALEEVLKDMPD